MTLYGKNIGAKATEIARAIRDGLEATARGERVRLHRYDGELLDADGLRAWFRDKLDGLINLKAGLRSDGAPKRERRACRCGACMHEHAHDLEHLEHAADLKWGATRCRACPSRPHEEWGGRKWDEDYQRNLAHDCRAIRDHATRRIVLHGIVTPELRARFAHYITTEE